MDNIDNCGEIKTDESVIAYSPHPATDEDGAGDCNAAGTAADDNGGPDDTSKNVGVLSVGNAEPVTFNHMTGHFTEALISTAAGGSDQTASWGGTPVIRPAVDDTNNDMMEVANYWTLTGVDAESGAGGGRLAEKDAGGMGVSITKMDARTEYAEPSDIEGEDGRLHE